MARVRCSCGREYNVPEKHLGQRVQCAACNATFIATAWDAPAPKEEKGDGSLFCEAPGRPFREKTPVPFSSLRLGELAVARGLVSREQVDACLSYQRAMRGLPDQQDLRLGSVLAGKRLITRSQLDGLLKEQGAGTVAAAATAAAAEIRERTGRRRGEEPVTEAQREALRRSAEAASQKLAEKEAAAAPRAPRWWERLRRVHFTIAGAVAVAALLVLILRPTPPAKLALIAYLQSCDEGAIAPDPELAWASLGLAVREFRDVKLHGTSRFTYAEELAAFQQEKGDRWAGLLQKIPMDAAKYEALFLVSAGLPEELSPRRAGSLAITVQPASSYIVFKKRGMGMYTEGRYLFLLLRVEAPAWRSGWRVATCEPLRIVKR